MYKAPIRLKSLYDIMHKYTYFIFDCDGVIFRFTDVIGNSFKILDQLHENGKKFYICTNNSKRGTEEIIQRFANAGYNLPKPNCISTPYLSSQYLLKKSLSSSIYLLGVPAFQKELESYGLSIWKSEGNKTISVKDVSTVVCGFDPEFCYKKLEIATRLIREGAEFVVADTDAYFKIGGTKFPGAAFVSYTIELTTGIKPTTIGKPSTFAFTYIIERDQLEEDKTKYVMIGDSLKTDIAFGINSGIDTILVLSGVTNIDALETSDIKPTYILDSL